MSCISAFFAFTACIGITLGDARADELMKSRLISPWGISDRRGVDAFGESLLSRDDRGTISTYLYQQTLLENVAAEQSSQNLVKGMGYAYKGLGNAAGAMGSVGTGPAGVAGAVFGGFLGDYGEYLIEEANSVATARVANYLHKEYGNIIRPNGTLNVERLRNIGDTELSKALNDPGFRAEVGDLDILNDIKTTAIVDMLQVNLHDSKILREGVDKLDTKLIKLNEGYVAVRRIQRKTLDKINAQRQVLGSIEGKVDNTKLLVTNLIQSNMPPQQVLALWNAGALQLTDDAAEGLSRRAAAADLKRDFDDAASVFKSAAQVFETLGMDAELVDATQKMGNLFVAGGAFAAAVTLGEPLSIFNTGANLFGSMGSMFGSRGGDSSQKTLQAIFKELRQLSNLIAQNHRDEMEALRRIGLKLVELEATMNRRFAELGLDVAYIQRDTRELLYEDVRVCERLTEEFALPETQALLTKGLTGFAIWFETDNRNIDYARCLNGLSARQRVVSESDYSGMLRADNLEEGTGGVDAAARRNAVRRLSQRILQPSVDYVREIRADDDSAKAAGKLYSPVVTLCDAYLRYGEASRMPACTATHLPTVFSRLKASEYNPGQGAWLSTPTTVLMSKFTRTVAAWNGVLIERTTGATSRVISEKEAQSITKLSASRRTRHVRALSDSIDALDLNLGQAQIVAGVPAIPEAVDILSKQVIPAYSKARREGNPEEINKLLAARDPSAATPGPQCATGNKAWDTLCLMEANSTFARNVVRALVAERVKLRDTTYDNWRRAVRSPFSDKIQSILGTQVILNDAASKMPSSTLGVWAIELPRVYSDPMVARPATGDGEITNCWQPAIVTRLFTEKNEIDAQNSFYAKLGSSRCYLLDPYTTQNFETISFATDYHALLTERLLASGLQNNLCAANDNYPKRYCPEPPQAKPQENGVIAAIAKEG